MLKLSIVETENYRRLVLEGKLISPWTLEVERAWETITDRLEGRRLIVDLTNVTSISDEGKDTLFKMMKDGASFFSRDVLTKHVLSRLARRCRCGG